MIDPGHPPPPPEPPPPGGVYGGPPRPPGAAAVPSLPWEDLGRHGFFPALFETIKVLVASPSEAFRRAKERGDYFSPLLFAFLMIVVGTVFAALWALVAAAIFPPPDLSPFEDMLPPNVWPLFEFLVDTSPAGIAYRSLASIPLYLVGLFLDTVVVHLFLVLVRGTATSKAGFGGSFRPACYATVSALAMLLPLVGQLVAIVWYLILLILGLAALHRTSHGKAAAAVLLPIVLCCVCFALLVVLAGVLGAGVLSGLSRN